MNARLPKVVRQAKAGQACRRNRCAAGETLSLSQERVRGTAPTSASRSPTARRILSGPVWSDS
jgi:hypothetical protein